VVTHGSEVRFGRVDIGARCAETAELKKTNKSDQQYERCKGHPTCKTHWGREPEVLVAVLSSAPGAVAA
jgi:hypothetical protein